MAVGLGALAASLLIAGCLSERTAGSTGVGNPVQGSVTVALLAEEPAAPAAKAGARAFSGRQTGNAVRNPDGSFDIRDLGGTLFTVRTGFANVGRIKFALPAGLDCTDADESPCEANEVSIEGPWVADLMAGSWAPEFEPLRLPVGDYRRLDVRLEGREDDQPGGIGLDRHSLVFGGTFAYAGRADRPFSIALDFDEDARFESDTAFTVAPGVNQAIVSLDIALWLSRADLTSCLEEGDLPLDAEGGFALDRDSHCDLEQELKEAIKNSGRLRGESSDD